jgi:hypothetical protein
MLPGLSFHGRIMRRALAFLLAITMTVAACGGGEEEPGPQEPAAPTADDDGASPQPAVTQPQVTIPPPDAPVNPAADDPDMVVDDDPGAGEGSTTEFCSFIADVDESQRILDDAFDPDSFREAMAATISGMQRASDLAPSEIEDDVEFVLSRFLGFVELLEEHDYNVMALATEATIDPRLSDMESPDFEAAVSRIGDFCGLDLVTDGPADDPGSASAGGGADVALHIALVPPGVVDSTDIGGGAVLFSSTASFADLVAFYTELLGEPLFSDETEMAALFQGSYEGAQYSVSMGAGDGTVEMLVTPM